MQAPSNLAKTYIASDIHLDKLDQIFQELFKLDSTLLKNEMTMADIERWDSLCHMTLIVSIEKNFGIELSFDDISRMQNIGEIRKIVTEKTRL